MQLVICSVMEGGHVRQVQVTVHSLCYHMEKMIAEKVESSVDSCHSILNKDMKMHSICQHTI
jgi:hypothetical protein